MAGKFVQTSIIERKKQQPRSITFQSCTTFVNWFKQLCETSVKYAGSNLYIHLSFCLLINPHVAGCAATWFEAAVYCISAEPQLEIHFVFKSHYMKTGNLSVRHFFSSHTFAHRSFGLNTQGSSFPPTRQVATFYPL